MNDSDYNDLVISARKSAILRKKRLIAIKKARQRKLRRIKFVICVVLAGLAVFIAEIVGTIHSGNSEYKSTINEKNTVQVAVDSSVNDDELPGQALMPEIVKSSIYTDINSENVKSPYISLIDVGENKMIAGRESDTKIYPASMTKVMTLIVAIENVKDTEATYTFGFDMLNRLYLEEASVAGFLENEMVSFNELLYGLILPSGAEAAEALAEIIAGSQEAFVKMMNQKCQDLGLKNTHFTNVSGLYNEDQYTTCTEMAVIMAYAMKNPECAKILSTYQYTTKSTQQHPEGILLTSTMFSRMYGTEVEGVTIIAGKTGYTNEARHCMVSCATKEDKTYVCVTAYADNKWHCIFDSFEIYRNYLP